LGHTLVKAVPSLFTFNCKDPLLTDLPGTSFEWANITIKELKTEEQGPLLITHWGLSGPAILKISAWKARELSEMDYQFDIVINFINQSIAEAEELFSDYKIQHPKKQLGQSKIFSITQRFWQKIIEVSNINPEKQIAQLNKREMGRNSI
jgi:predicted flavoprotein YhiN